MSGDAQFVEVTYRGLELAPKARMSAVDGAWFVEHEAPLPVGAKVVVQRPGAPPLEGRVIGVVEQEAGAKSPPGMRVSFGEALPAPAAAPEPQLAPRDQAAPEPADSDKRTEMMTVPDFDPGLAGDDPNPPGDAGGTVRMDPFRDATSGPVSSDEGDPDRSSPGDAAGGRRGRRGRRKPNGR